MIYTPRRSHVQVFNITRLPAWLSLNGKNKIESNIFNVGREQRNIVEFTMVETR
jgi:hypothetical protein